MFLSSELLRKLIIDDDLIKPYLFDIDFLEGSQVMTSLGSVLEVSNLFDNPYIGKEKRVTPSFKEIQPTTGSLGKPTWMLKSGNFYQLQTVETVKLPAEVVGLIFPRRTWFISGVQVITTAIAPGYNGKLSYGAQVISPVDVEVEQGAPLCALMFALFTEGDTGLYKHVTWGGDKTETNGWEKGY